MGCEKDNSAPLKNYANKCLLSNPTQLYCGGMDSYSITAISLRDDGRTGSGLAASVGPHTLVRLKDNSIAVKLYSSPNSIKADSESISHAFKVLTENRLACPVHLAEATLTDGSVMWAVRLVVPVTVPALAGARLHDTTAEPLYLMLAHVEPNKIAPRLFQWPQHAMAVASEICETLAGGAGSINWNSAVVENYAINMQP